MPRVLVVGDVIIDILVETPRPVVHGDDNPASIRIRPGGSAANQAAWMASLGLDVTFAGRAGAPDAELHRAELARFGVEPRLAADPDAPTGSIVVLIGLDGERTMITDRGANLKLQAADVPATLLDGADLLHLTGYTFFSPGPRAVALGLIAETRRRGIPFTVDPGSVAFLSDLAPDEFVTWTAGAAVCFPNQEEAVALLRQAVTARPAVETGAIGSAAGAAATGPAAKPEQAAYPAAMADALTRHYGTVALKLGQAGAVLATRTAPPIYVPALPAGVRDTTGAGDAFCAAFLAAWLAGVTLPAAAAAGTRAAALAVATLGGRPALAD